MYKLGSLNDDALSEVLWKTNCPSQAERHWGEKPALTSAPDGMGNKKSLPWEFFNTSLKSCGYETRILLCGPKDLKLNLV